MKDKRACKILRTVISTLKRNRPRLLKKGAPQDGRPFRLGRFPFRPLDRFGAALALFGLMLPCLPFRPTQRLENYVFPFEGRAKLKTKSLWVAVAQLTWR